MKTQKMHTSPHAVVNKLTHTKGADIGDYFYVVRGKDDSFIARFSNRLYSEAVKCADNHMPNNKKL